MVLIFTLFTAFIYMSFLLFVLTMFEFFGVYFKAYHIWACEITVILQWCTN